MTTSDQELIQNILARDDRAFEKLLKRYLKPVYNFIYQLTNDSSVIDDLTQETFIKVWKNLRRFDKSKNFKVWLFAIAKNTAYDFLKKKKTVPFSYYTDGEGNNKLTNISDGQAQPQELAIKNDLARAIDKKLKKMPVHYRSILILRYKEDFSLQEIALILKKPYNTIKSQHQRALSYFKKNLPLD
ncbi:MAG: RNA polymerase sigma factor [Candidatus Moraniibacteriota bacterium]